MRVAGLVAAGLLVLLGATGWGINAGLVHLPYPSSKDFPVRGVDVSNHQGPIRWDGVRSAGFRFAFVKASEGGTFTDPLYRTLSAGARRAGLRVGPYHYFTLCTDGLAQAQRFVAVSGGRVPGDLPPVVDLEFGGNCSNRPSAQWLDEQYEAFDTVVSQAFGRPPLVYTTSDFAGRYLEGAREHGSVLADRQLWLRDLWHEPAGGCGHWTFWQYASRGRVPGVSGPVDLNAFCGSPDAFADLGS